MRMLGVWTRVILYMTLTFTSTACAFDISIPLPKPNLPPIPTPAFMSKPSRKVSEKEIQDAQNERDRTREAVKIADERSKTSHVAQNSDSERQYFNSVDLTPSFSDLLPYCMVLGRVVCESNMPLDSVQGLQAELVQLQIDLTTYLQIPEANEKIELCVFKDRQSYQNFIKSVFPGAPTDRPALYIRRGDEPGVLMVQNDSGLIVNVRHEMTHAYLNSTLKHVPIWLDEGLAKYFETPPGERGFRNPYLADVENQASGWFSSPPSLPRLEKLTRVDQMRPREYRESWSWVHFMLHYSPETHRALIRYLKTLRRENQSNISTEDAYKIQKKAPLKQALSDAVPDYEKKYVEHFRNWDKRQAAYENGRAESDL